MYGVTRDSPCTEKYIFFVSAVSIIIFFFMTNHEVFIFIEARRDLHHESIVTNKA